MRLTWPEPGKHGHDCYNEWASQRRGHRRLAGFGAIKQTGEPSSFVVGGRTLSIGSGAEGGSMLSDLSKGWWFHGGCATYRRGQRVSGCSFWWGRRRSSLSSSGSGSSHKPRPDLRKSRLSFGGYGLGVSCPFTTGASRSFRSPVRGHLFQLWRSARKAFSSVCSHRSGRMDLAGHGRSDCARLLHWGGDGPSSRNRRGRTDSRRTRGCSNRNTGCGCIAGASEAVAAGVGSEPASAANCPRSSRSRRCGDALKGKATVCKSSSSATNQLSRLGKAAATGRTSSYQGDPCGRGAWSSSPPSIDSREGGEGLFTAGIGTWGGRNSRGGAATGHAGWQFDGADADDPNSAKLLATAETGRGKVIGSFDGCPQRLGQRVRKQLRCKGLRGSRDLFEKHPGLGGHSRHREAERDERTGDDCRSRRFIDHEEVCGKEDGSGRTQDAGVCGNIGGRRLGGGSRDVKLANDGLPLKTSDVCGADLFGSGSDAVGMAVDRLCRPSFQSASWSEGAQFTETFLDPGTGLVGVSKHRLHEGPGLFRRPDGHYWATTKARKGGRPRCASKESKAKEERSREGQRQPDREHNCLSSTAHSSDQCSLSDLDPDKFYRGAQSIGSTVGFPDFSSQACVGPAADNLPDTSPNKFFNPPELILQICNNLLKSHTGLSNFAISSFRPSPSCAVHGELPVSQLWPVPPPRWRWSGSPNLGSRRRLRRRWHMARHRLLQLVVVSLNWETLGHPLIAPVQARAGFPLSVQQHEILERLEDQLTHFLSVGEFASDDLGRAAVKFQDLIRLCKELPQCTFGGEDLELIVSALHVSFDPYSSNYVNHHKPEQPIPERSCLKPGVEVRPHLNVGSLPVVADRVKWDHPPSFKAEEFLDNELVRAAFLDPEVLRMPSHMWPKKTAARVQCSREELLALANRWDALGACSLIRASDKNFDEAVGLFSVPKDVTYDRLIVNPTVINSRMFKVSDATKSLAPGAMLGLLTLEPHELWRFNADDLTDFYYTFQVTSSRAARNAIRRKFHSSEVAHFSCYDTSHDGHDLLICLSTLAMGDSLAVEVAQQAHGNVLRKLCGAMRSNEVLKYRSPCPRGDFVELLAIDDHVGLQKLPIDEYPRNPVLRDSDVFAASEKAYKQVGLIQHERKRKRNQTRGTILGADFDGLKGRVMAPRDRIMVLSVVTGWIARRGTCTPHVLSMVLGCWIHVLLFRRSLFAVVDALFKEGKDTQKHTVFCLSRQARNELLLLSILGSVSHSDLRCTYHNRIYCTDASPCGAAVVSAPISSKITKELWRHCEQKGYYTRLQSPASAYLSECGLTSEFAESLSPEPPDSSHGDIFEPVPKPLTEGILFDCVELFRGSGAWSKYHQEAGLCICIHDGFDIDGRRLKIGDLLDDGIFREVSSLAIRRVVKEWHCGLPCLSFGTLRRPQVRSIKEPFGFNCHDPFTAMHNKLAIRSAIILILAVSGGQYISVEQPGSSRLFLLDLYKVLVLLGCVISKFAFCAHGSGFNKRSKWLHNKPWLLPLESTCRCPGPESHFRIEGTFTRESIKHFEGLCNPSCEAVYGCSPRPGERVSSFSAAYPRSLMQSMAAGSAAARRAANVPIPFSKRLESFKIVGLDPDSSVPWPAEEEKFPDRPWHQDPEWISELCESLPFKEMFRYQFARPGHINVNEARTYKTWLKSMAKSYPDTRFVGILDSRVTLGAAAKGRSSSFAISRVLQGTLGYVIGGGLYPGGLHCYSHQNRADEPSRNKSVRGPTKDVPLWLTELAAGRVQMFDAVVASSRFEKLAARWLRFLLLLGGDIERHPGPQRQPRGVFDLRVGFEAHTASTMDKCLAAFSAWVESHAKLKWDALTLDAQALATALRAYGIHCFESGLPRYMFVYSITAVQDQFPLVKNFSNIAWQVDKKWQQFEPGTCRPVLPSIVIRALICLSTLWGWHSLTGIVMLGFAAMLHPSEMLSLTRRDLVFPRDLGFDNTSLYIHLRNPKTSRFARRQHGRIDDPIIIAVAERLFGALELDARLFKASIGVFRKQWNLLLDRLGIPYRKVDQGATPAVLRGSGATHLYSGCEDIAWIAWRGRWARTRTLEFYLQEVGAQTLIHQLHPFSRAKVLFLEQFALAVLCRELDLQCSI